MARAKHENLFRQRHGFHLVVSDVDAGGGKALMQPAQFYAHLVAEIGVEVGERFVEEEHAGFAHDGASHGHSLALAAGKLAGHAGEQSVQSEELGGFLGAALAFLGGNAAHLQAVGDVVVHVHVRVERVVLEHHGDVAVLGFHVRHIPVADVDGAGGHFLQTGDAAQSRGLAAARGTHHDHEGAVGHFEVEAGEDFVLVEGLVYVAKTNVCHCLFLVRVTSRFPQVRGRRASACRAPREAGAACPEAPRP